MRSALTGGRRLNTCAWCPLRTCSTILSRDSICRAKIEPFSTTTSYHELAGAPLSTRSTKTIYLSRQDSPPAYIFAFFADSDDSIRPLDYDRRAGESASTIPLLLDRWVHNAWFTTITSPYASSLPRASPRLLYLHPFYEYTTASNPSAARYHSHGSDANDPHTSYTLGLRTRSKARQTARPGAAGFLSTCWEEGQRGSRLELCRTCYTPAHLLERHKRKLKSQSPGGHDTGHTQGISTQYTLELSPQGYGHI